jgi:hypothetical protein
MFMRCHAFQALSGGTIVAALQLVVIMNPTSKSIGTELRRIFDAIRRPMGWGVIDALSSLEEQEEERLRRAADAPEAVKDKPPPTTKA